MLDSDKVKASEVGKTRLREAIKQAQLTQEKLASNTHVSVDTIKRLLGVKPAPNGVERWVVKSIANHLNINPLDIVAPQDWYQNLQLLQEFEVLIQEKIRSFCGRKFVFDAFKNFLNKYPKGYFTVIGDAGMGKSAIAAKYVDENQAICYFNVLQERNNRPELFIKSIRQQLINRYYLENAENDDLSALLIKASNKIVNNQPLVIVIDALDEVEQAPGGENILYLPKTLPDKVYFWLTRRRYEPGKKRLYTEGVEQVELDLNSSR
ncbi:hypothetical protein NIES25_28640 [Nostoc linckia NIES-25]|nr:hypothetical protein NIES25_28640 [Nostoc linckia NIES-25]